MALFKTTSGASNMTVLVTGGAGYIGSHMVLELLDRGEKVVVLDNLSTGFDWVVPEGVTLFVGETGNQSLVSSIIRAHDVRSIIHFAASIVVPDSVSDPLSYYLNNTVNSRAMIEAAVKGGVSNIIFSSTAAVYGTPDKMPISEDDRMNPESPYGMSPAHRPILGPRDASDQDRGRGRGGQTRGHERLRNGLPYARRDLPEGLYPCQRSCPRAFRSAGSSEGGR
jgi:hypothetical protein